VKGRFKPMRVNASIFTGDSFIPVCVGVLAYLSFNAETTIRQTGGIVRMEGSYRRKTLTWSISCIPGGSVAKPLNC
jgi:hypothetical protein